MKAPPAARCPAGGPREAGRLQLSAPAYVTDESTGVADVRARHPHGREAGQGERHRHHARGLGRRRAATSGDHARPSPSPTGTPRRGSSRSRSSRTGEPRPARRSRSRCRIPAAQSWARSARAEVTIVDDDTPPAAAAELHDRRHGRRPPGVGPRARRTSAPSSTGLRQRAVHASPARRADGLPYDVSVKTQPQQPRPGLHGEPRHGHGRGADVTDVAVHCATPAPPPGLDPTFGSDGRVSTPVGGREGRGGGHPARRRHRHRRPAGLQRRHRLRAHAPRRRRQPRRGLRHRRHRHDRPGQRDRRGLRRGAAPRRRVRGRRAHRRGRLQPRLRRRPLRRRRHARHGFGGDGIVTTDFAGQVDQANAVAVQPDGKIVVAGLATARRPIGADGDFALARYNADGTPDTSFGGDGIVTTDLGTTVGRRPRASSSSPTAGSSSPAPPAGTSRSCATPPTATSTPPSATRGVDDHRPRLRRLRQRRRADRRRPDPRRRPHARRAGSTSTSARPLQRRRHPGHDVRHHGVVKTDVGGGDDFAENLTVQPDGRIVVVGRATSATILDMAVVRYHADGTPGHRLRRRRQRHRRLPRQRRVRPGRRAPAPTARSSPPATPPTASTPSSPSCGSTPE